MKRRLALIALFFNFAACNNSSSDSSGGGQGANHHKPNRLNWESVSKEFNPHTEEASFRTDSIEKMKIDIFKLKNDVEIIYSPGLEPNTGALKIFKVWKEAPRWGSLVQKSTGKTLELKMYGMNECSIQITNGQITELKGGCYVKVQVFRPVGVEIEVYNAGTLISKRFVPIDIKTFLENLDDANWADGKFQAIEDFIQSYEGTSKAPKLLTEDLAVVINEFIQREDQFKALRRLHVYITDRQNLPSMIEKEFGYFDREEAGRIVGL